MKGEKNHPSLNSMKRVVAWLDVNTAELNWFQLLAKPH